MAGRNDTDYYKKLLLDFITEPDPLFFKLQWLTHRMMELEAESKAGAPKGRHSTQRKTHFSGTRVRHFDRDRVDTYWYRSCARAAIFRSLSQREEANRPCSRWCRRHS